MAFGTNGLIVKKHIQEHQVSNSLEQFLLNKGEIVQNRPLFTPDKEVGFL